MFLHLRLNGTFFLFAPIGLVDRRLDRRPVLGEKARQKDPTRGMIRGRGRAGAYPGAWQNIAERVGECPA